MRALSLDFVQRPRPAPLGWALLALGVVLALASLLTHHALAGQAAQLRAQVQAAQRELHGEGGAVASGLPAVDQRAQDAGLAEMRRISAQLRRPWERLFASLEALPRSDVALLSLAPDARKGQLRISAEARNLEAMLTFHRKLEESDGLRDVSLLNHEVVSGQAERPVLFNLLATWEVQDARL
ncbi:hypothetical protein D9M68_150090 [compost metagenome]